MLRIDQLRLLPDQPESDLTAKCARLLRTDPSSLRDLTVLRRAIDAREGLTFVYTVAVSAPQEAALLRRCRDKRVTAYVPEQYVLPAPVAPPEVRPIVVGAGPAGLSAALVLAKCGARPILLERGPPVEQRSRHHVGTDKLHIALRNLRQQLLDAGADIRFGARLEGFTAQGGALTAITCRQGDSLYTIPAQRLILALGHSARDTFETLYESGLAMEPKPFAMGVRIEHRQSAVDAARYRQLAGHPALPPATYKLSCHLPNGRSAFSFCVCPGGQVVAAASEEQRVVTNGMSEYARDRENINGALLVNVTPADFPDGHPLAGIRLQRQLEDAAFALGGGDYRAPCQRVGDFLAGRPSTGAGTVQPSYLPGVTYTDLRRCLPAFISETLALALPELGRKLRGYDDPDALLTGIETRSSSPVRLVRDDRYESNIRGVYPCGEGAGYAGGILSAAADGMRCAEKLLEVYR